MNIESDFVVRMALTKEAFTAKNEKEFEIALHYELLMVAEEFRAEWRRRRQDW